MKQFNYIIKKSISHWLVLFFSLIFGSCFSQHNLVPNYSFEDSATCPSAADSDYLPHLWYRPTTVAYQSGWYLNSCTTNPLAGVPYNGVGFQYAYTGQAYAYVRCYTVNINTNRDYLQAKLKDSFISGKQYYTEFYTSVANKGAYGCNNISVLFTKKVIYVDTLVDPTGVIAGNAQIYNYSNPIITDTMNWVKVSGIFKAQGGERFITIGNFKYENQTNRKLINSTTSIGPSAGYYVDDVSVIPLDSFCLKADAGRDTTINAGDSVFIGSLTNGIDSIKWYANGTTLIDSIRPGFWLHPTTVGSYMYVLHQTVNGCFSSDTVYLNVVLPLNFLKYEVLSTNEKQVENRWTTANEINVSHFNIQRSTNGKDFTTIHKEQAKNHTLNNYTYDDNSLPFMVNGSLLYYRVMSVDKDGKTNFSEVRQVLIRNEQLAINVFPNPAKDFVNVECKYAKEVLIIDCLGRVVYKEILRQAQNDATVINIKNLNKGLYVVQVINKNGDVKSDKLIVQ